MLCNGLASASARALRAPSPRVVARAHVQPWRMRRPCLELSSKAGADRALEKKVGKNLQRRADVHGDVASVASIGRRSSPPPTLRRIDFMAKKKATRKKATRKAAKKGKRAKKA